MKPVVVFAPAARDDLDSIGEYLLENTPLETALRIVENIESAVEHIAGHPQSGHKREDLGAGAISPTGVLSA